MGATRPWATRAAEALLLTGATLGVAEAVFRQVNPEPRLQIVRANRPGAPSWDITLRDGVPTWRDVGSEERQNRICQRPETFDVVLLGTSITYGVGLSPSESVGLQLQGFLDARAPGRFCVLDFSQPAYTGASRKAELPEILTVVKPELVLWEAWGTDADAYTMVAGDAYNFSSLSSPGTLPRLLPLPEPLHTWLFVHSRLYPFATIALKAPDPERLARRWPDWLEGGFADVVRSVRAGGADFAFYAPSALDAPLAVPASELTEVEVGWAAFASAHGVPSLDLATAMADVSDPVTIRADPCCHLNAAGSRRVALELADWMLSEVVPAQASPGATDPTGEAPASGSHAPR